MNRFRVMSEDAGGDAYLLCWEHGCDDEFKIEDLSLVEVNRIAEEHQKEKHE